MSNTTSYKPLAVPIPVFHKEDRIPPSVTGVVKLSGIAATTEGFAVVELELTPEQWTKLKVPKTIHQGQEFVKYLKATLLKLATKKIPEQVLKKA